MGIRLFFGPVARDTALQTAESEGRLISDVIGDGGLKVDDSRTIVELASHAGVGDKKPFLVVGPVDEATPEAADALLKTLEESTSASLQILLWAHHRNSVIPTILSRVHAVWCPGPPVVRWEDMAGVSDLWAALKKQDFGSVLGVLRKHKGTETDLLNGVLFHLEKEAEDPAASVLWVRIREALQHTPVSPLRAADALVGGT